MNKRCEICNSYMKYYFIEEKYKCTKCNSTEELHQVFREPPKKGEL